MAHRDFKDTRGATMLEAAIALLVFLMIVLGIIDLARVGILKSMLHNASQLAVRDLKIADGIDSDNGAARTAASVSALNRGRNFLLSGLFYQETALTSSYAALLPDPLGLVGGHTGRLIFPSYANGTSPAGPNRQYDDLTQPGQLARDLASIPVGATFSAQISPYFFPFFGTVTLTETAYGFVEQRQVPAAPVSPGCFSAGNCPCPFAVPVAGQPPASWNGTNCFCPGGVNSNTNSGAGTFSCTCPIGTVWNTAANRCDCANPPTCAGNQFLDSNCQCQTCPTNYRPNGAGNGCECMGWDMPCLPTQIWVLWNCTCGNCPAGQHPNDPHNNCDCDVHSCPANQYYNTGSNCACSDCPANQIPNGDQQGCHCPNTFTCSGNTINQNCNCVPCQGAQVANAGHTACICPTNLGPCGVPEEIRTGTDCNCACPNGSGVVNTVDAGAHCVPFNACPRAGVDCYWNNGNPYQPEDP